MVSSVSSVASAISQLFTKLDSQSKGYLEKSDFTSAFSQIGSSTSSSTDSSGIDKVFAALDSNNDGKVTESEFSSTLNKLKTELDSQFDSMRMSGFTGTQGVGGMSGMPPPPPQNDTGFTKDELQNQLDQIGSTDSKRSSFISNVVNNFSAADSNSDGKVSFAEAQAYNSSSDTNGASSTATTSRASTAATSDTSSSSVNNTDAQVLMKIMQLMQAYGSSNQNQLNSAFSGQFSVSA